MGWHFAIGRLDKFSALEEFRATELSIQSSLPKGHLSRAAQSLLYNVPAHTYVSISSHGYSNSDGSGGASVSVNFGVPKE
jgi:hypothetical protein